MPSIDVKKRKIDSKVVYCGPGRSGKTANLKYVYDHLDADHRGRFASMPTKGDPDLHIDVLPVRFGKIFGFHTTYHLCSGPGQAMALNTRRLLLRDTDGIVFVADSRPNRMDANVDSMLELRECLDGYEVDLANIPHVVQYNKADLVDQVDIGALRASLNRHGMPDFLASTKTGEGIMETLRAVVRAVADDLQKRL